MKAYTLTATERDFLVELDKIINWHTDNGKPISSLLLSKKQAASFKRMAKKGEAGCKFYNDYGEVEIEFHVPHSGSSYRGVKLLAREERSRYTAKSLKLLPL